MHHFYGKLDPSIKYWDDRRKGYWDDRRRGTRMTGEGGAGLLITRPFVFNTSKTKRLNISAE